MAVNGKSIFTVLNTAFRPKMTPVTKTSGAQRKKRRRQKLASQEQGVQKEPQLLAKPNPSPSTSGIKRPHPVTKPTIVTKKSKKIKPPVIPELKLAIVIDGYPDKKLSDAQYNLFTKNLLERLDDVAVPLTMPRFHQCYLAWGAAMVTCADQYSKVWLQDNVPLLKLSDGVKLKIMETDARTSLTRAAVWIPGCACKTDVLLKRMSRQNPGLVTRSWKVYSREDEPGKGCRLILGMDSSGVVLKGTSFRPFLGLGRVTFKFLDSKPAKTTNDK